MISPRPLIPVILCGGKGTRLWPLSRASYPKQYWALNNVEQETLLQQTQLRLQGLKKLSNPLLICNEEHRFIVAEQMREIKIEPKAILLEPVGRNTGPAIALAALHALESGEDPLLLILAADHVIKDRAHFLAVIEAGRKYAEEGRLVTFGIVPTSPETGYGYIEAKEKLENVEPKGIPIARFVEKPDRELAEKFLRDDRFTWNSGIFLFRASTILQELNKLSPELLRHCKEALNQNIPDMDFLRINKNAFMKCPNIAIDVAVMEKTKLGTVLPLDAGWSDIGSWNALWETTNQDKEGNAIRGNVINQECKNCYLRSEYRLLVGIGIENLIVVETDDAVLIANREHTQNVKAIVKKLEETGSSEGIAHRKIYRPWGSYTRVVEGSRWQVKRIKVNPGASLSLQMHHHRAEHWIVVKGTALIEKDQTKELLGENQSTYIPLGCKHRLSNPGTEPIELIEVQSGSYLGEDDIVRFADEYDRISTDKS